MKKTLLSFGLALSLCLSALAAGPSLHEAARSGDLAQIKAALAQGADINATHYNLEEGYDFLSAPIVLAAEQKQYLVVEYLLQQGANPNQAVFNWTALHAAVDNHDLKTAALLLKYKANPNIGLEVDTMGKAFYNEGGQTPLIRAAGRSELEMVKLLLANGADPLLEAESVPTSNDALGFALMAEKPNRALVELLLSKGYPVGSKGDYLTAAVLGGQAALIELLLQRGAKVNVPHSNGDPILVTALIHQQVPLIKLLLDKGANPWQRDRHGKDAAVQLRDYFGDAKDVKVIEPLLAAARRRQLDAIRTSLKGKPNLNAADEAGWTPLFKAVAARDKVLTEQLLARGAKLDLIDSNGYTPLLLALQFAPELLEPLLAKVSKGQALEMQSPYGSPLHLAVAREDLAQVKLLLAKGADPNHEQLFDRFYLSDEHRCSDGVTPKTCWISFNDTPLRTAIAKNNRELVNMLLDGGADPRKPNSQGINSLENLPATTDPELVKLLESHL